MVMDGQELGWKTKMYRIPVFLLIAGISLRTAVAQDAKVMKMEGGAFIDDVRLFSEIVNLKKKKDAADAGETKCMGIIFSSPVIFTSMLCEITDADKNMWVVEPITTSLTPAGNVTFDVNIAAVSSGRHKLDFKKIDMSVPGLELAETNMGTMPIAAPFNQNPDDEMPPGAVVFAFGDRIKACSIKILSENPHECTNLYKGITAEHPNLGLPAEPDTGIFCAIKGDEKMNATLMNTEDTKTMFEIDVGMPCDDSLGSPVYADRMVFGMVVGAFCGTAKVVLIQPSIRGLSLESDTETGGPPTAVEGNDGITSSGENDGRDAKGSASRHDKTEPPKQQRSQGTKNGSSPIVLDHIQICSVLIGAFAAF